MSLQQLFSQYDSVMVLDTETSGLDFRREEIIEFACACLRMEDGQLQTLREYDELIRLSDGKRLDPYITKLTGISETDLSARGISKKQLCTDLSEMLSENVLIIAYNTHFDLSFMFYLLQRENAAQCLRGKDKLDLLTVYRDRHDYPHKLKNAIEVYQLQGRVVNSHRAIDDVKATIEVMREMDTECDDLHRYINLFGYNPKYGVQGHKISSVRYLPQGFDRRKKLYE